MIAPNAATTGRKHPPSLADTRRIVYSLHGLARIFAGPTPSPDRQHHVASVDSGFAGNQALRELRHPVRTSLSKALLEFHRPRPFPIKFSPDDVAKRVRYRRHPLIQFADRPSQTPLRFGTDVVPKFLGQPGCLGCLRVFPDALRAGGGGYGRTHATVGYDPRQQGLRPGVDAVVPQRREVRLFLQIQT